MVFHQPRRRTRMRRKKEAVLCFESNDDGLPKVVREYRARFRAISQVLDDNPKILTAVHEDILKLSEGDSQGREGDFTSENILRALIVQDMEGLPFRDAVNVRWCWQQTRGSARRRASSRSWRSWWRTWRSRAGCRTSWTSCWPAAKRSGPALRGLFPA